MFGTREAFLERKRQWRRFNEWEAAHPDLWPGAGLDDKWHWFCNAWETARRLNPWWITPEIDLEKIERLRLAAAALAALEGKG